MSESDYSSSDDELHTMDDANYNNNELLQLKEDDSELPLGMPDPVGFQLQFVDFMQDFGASELFLIDGDALLAQTLVDPMINSRADQQVLHIVRSFENVLCNLRSRGARFEIFFAAGAEIWRAIGSWEWLVYQAVVRHIRDSNAAAVAQGKPMIVVIHEIIGGWWSGEEFNNLLDNIQPTFVMTDYRWAMDKLLSKEADSNVIGLLRYMPRAFVMSLFNSTIHCVMIEGMIMRGSRVFGHVTLLPAMSLCKDAYKFVDFVVKYYADFLDVPKPTWDFIIEESSSEETNDHVLKAAAALPSHLSRGLRTRFAAASLALLPKSNRVASLSKDLIGDYSRVWCICVALMRRMSLQARSLELSSASLGMWLSDEDALNIRNFVAALHDILARLFVSDNNVCIENNEAGNVAADIMDGRLFMAVLLTAGTSTTSSPFTDVAIWDQVTIDDATSIWNAASSSDLPDFSAPANTLDHARSIEYYSSLKTACSTAKAAAESKSAVKLPEPVHSPHLRHALGGLMEHMSQFQENDTFSPKNANVDLENVEGQRVRLLPVDGSYDHLVANDELDKCMQKEIQEAKDALLRSRTEVVKKPLTINGRPVERGSVLRERRVVTEEQKRRRREQKWAVSRQKFLMSLAADSPAKQVKISALRSADDVTKIQKVAARRLVTGTSADCPDDDSKKDKSGGGKKGGKALIGGKDKIREDNIQRRADEDAARLMPALQAIKTPTSMYIDQRTFGGYIDQLDAIISRCVTMPGGVVEVMARARRRKLDALREYAEADPSLLAGIASSHRRNIFLAIQATLRAHPPPLPSKLAKAAVKAAQLAELPDLSNAVQAMSEDVIGGGSGGGDEDASSKKDKKKDKKKDDKKEKEKAKKKAEKAKSKVLDVVPTVSPRYQLEHCWEYLKRRTGMRDDSRVSFRPDSWQLELLDIVDAGQSALIVAPTSTGKTFISFYAMESVLRASNDSVVVYVGPSKALCQQVYAEVTMRLAKMYKHTGHHLAGIFNRDYRENVEECQILVTMPLCLELLLLSAGSSEWASRIKYLIVDEVHCIGGFDGDTWERILLLNDAPLLALSATLGDASYFHEWLARVDRHRITSTGGEVRSETLRLIEVSERFNFLRPYLYVPGEVASSADEVMVPIHPVAAICRGPSGDVGASTDNTVDDVFRFPPDLKLLPPDCVKLVDICLEVFGLESVHELLPETFFKSNTDLTWNISMTDTVRWEKSIKSRFLELARTCSPEKAEEVVSRVGAATMKALDSVDDAMTMEGVTPEGFLKDNAYAFIRELHNRGMLPAICFSWSRPMCEHLTVLIAQSLVNEEAEVRKKEDWAGQVERTEKKLRAAEEALKNTTAAKPGKGSSAESIEAKDDANDSRGEVADLRRRLRTLHAPDPRFCLTNQAPSEEELKESFGYKQRGVIVCDDLDTPLISALRRGVACHHGGLSRKYRMAVERFFRVRRIGAVFSTSTLAVGINMPAATAVFCGDDIHLNAINYRQMAGRAGRRGFDLCGNVVFFGIPRRKVVRLLRSQLPMLQGNLTANASILLRMAQKLYYLNAAAEAPPPPNVPGSGAIRAAAETGRLRSADAADRFSKAVERALTMPLMASAALMPQEVELSLMFEMDFLRNREQMSITGQPSDITDMVSHLYEWTPANFAFSILLENGVFDRIVNPDDENNEDLMYDDDGNELPPELNPKIKERVVSVLANLFCRIPLHTHSARQALAARSNSDCPSLVILPPLPDFAHSLLENFNAEALAGITSYQARFSRAYSKELGPDNKLPLTRIEWPLPHACESLSSGIAALELPKSDVRSSFVAIAGHGDRCESFQDLCHSLRDGCFLDESLIPMFDGLVDEQLNAYALDFYRHGSHAALLRYNLLDKNTVWSHVYEFQSVLLSLWAALQRRFDYANQRSDEEKINVDYIAPASAELIAVFRAIALEFRTAFENFNA